ncbi:RNA recognition motif [Terrimicrobium sacchariphilum]|jgi:RNA recognition motif-containing protein|uniref:RNA recognition motif n=1 Tax=Terrimicrobium sacchariphilum TaxID=690879 RepID=A0A146G8D9_TERSA|nr:RNA-binding protein [Terrimicrobium sacchariphilum]GAT33164.1 RNA recognition motif [Terrimicrobium sacchariphilum]
MKLYVGNLSFKTTEQALEELFASVGTVTDTHLVMDRMTQRPRGFGFVTMSTEEEGQKAIESLNGKTFDGRPISVSVARPKEDRPPRRDFGGEGGGGGGFREHRDRDRDRDRRGGGGYDRRRN